MIITVMDRYDGLVETVTVINPKWTVGQAVASVLSAWMNDEDRIYSYGEASFGILCEEGEPLDIYAVVTA